MADYVPLLARAIASLPENNAAARQAVFARARTALERQLRGISPPMPEAEILAIQVQLEDAIRVVEAEQASLAVPIKDEPAPDAMHLARAARAPAPLPEADEAIDDGGIAPLAPSAPAKPNPQGRIKMPIAANAGPRHRGLVLFAVIGTLALSGMGLLAFAQRDEAARLPRPPSREEAELPGGDQAKREGRLGAGETAPAGALDRAAAPRASLEPSQPSANAPLPVSSRAFMVLESPGNPPSQFEGRTIWRFGPEESGKPGEAVLRIQIEYSNARLAVDLTMSRNADATLAASHTILAVFDPRNGLGAVKQMSAIEWREREGQPGALFAASQVPVQDNVFLLALDGSESARTRNQDLMRNQKWLVFEIRLADNRRGALLIEKGSSGDAAINTALAAWK